MTVLIPVTIPLLNPNEPGARLVDIFVSSGQRVSRGDKLCTLETTKSASDLLVEADGFVIGLSFTTGQTAQAGDIFCYIAESPDQLPPVLGKTMERLEPALDAGLRISQPALKLAQENQLDLSTLPQDVFITETIVRERIYQSIGKKFDLKDHHFEPNSVIIFGGGGHGKALIDLVRLSTIHPIAGIVDDGLIHNSTILGVPVLGDSTILDTLVTGGVHLAVNAVGGIGNITSRIKVFERLSAAGFSFPTLIHPSAFVEPSAELSQGVQVLPHAYIGSEAHVGFGVIVNTGAIVSHDCSLDEYVNLSPGAILAGEVHVGAATLIGMSVTVNLRVQIGADTRIGNGATIKQDVPAGQIVHAGTIWPK